MCTVPYQPSKTLKSTPCNPAERLWRLGDNSAFRAPGVCSGVAPAAEITAVWALQGAPVAAVACKEGLVRAGKRTLGGPHKLPCDGGLAPVAYGVLDGSCSARGAVLPARTNVTCACGTACSGRREVGPNAAENTSIAAVQVRAVGAGEVAPVVPVKRSAGRPGCASSAGGGVDLVRTKGGILTWRARWKDALKAAVGTLAVIHTGDTLEVAACIPDDPKPLWHDRTGSTRGIIVSVSTGICSLTRLALRGFALQALVPRRAVVQTVMTHEGASGVGPAEPAVQWSILAFSADRVGHCCALVGNGTAKGTSGAGQALAAVVIVSLTA